MQEVWNESDTRHRNRARPGRVAPGMANEMRGKRLIEVTFLLKQVSLGLVYEKSIWMKLPG